MTNHPDLQDHPATDWPNGYVHVYTGDGKGKSTAAFGLAMRAAGAELPVYVAQFVKGMRYSEINAFERFDDLIEIHQFGRGCFILRKPTPEDAEAAQNGLCEVRKILAEGRHRLVILDEANIATFYNLFSVEDLLDVIDRKPQHVELVVTGRRADPRILERADLVTEMREVKHYYNQGVQARKGIEN